MKPYYQDNVVTIYQGNAVDTVWKMQPESVQCVITSPPYWGLRDYGVDGQIGLEKTPEEYTENLVEIFRQVKDVMRDDGIVWLNLGDCYATGAGKVGDCPGGGEQGARWKGYRGTRRSGKQAYLTDKMGPMIQPNRMPLPGLKPKDLVGIPWRVAFALQADGWYLRSDIIWSKPNPMPESVTDRPTKAHEYVFLLTKSERYYFDHDAVKEPCTYGHEIQWDPGTNGLGGDDRKTGKSTRRFSKSGNKDRKLDVPTRPFDHRGSSIPFAGVYRNIRSVWTIATQPYPEAHFATFPEDLVKPCVLAGSKPGDIVMDCFCGSGTALYVAKELGRRAIGVELKAEYIDLAAKRLRQEVLKLEARE